MSQFKRYLNIINELKVPEMGLKNAKEVLKEKALKDLRLDPEDLSEKQNEEVFNAYFNYKHLKKVPEWSEIRSAMTGSIVGQIRDNKLDEEVVEILLEMLKKSVEKSGYVTERTTVKNDAIDNLEVQDYIKNPSIIHKIVNGKVVDGKIVDGNNKIIIDKN